MSKILSEIFSSDAGGENSLIAQIQNNALPTYRQAYSDRTAWLMVCLSDLAYQSFDATGAELESIGISVEKTYDKEDTRAFLLSNDQFLILAFRGTEANSFKRVKADMRARKVLCETGGNIHLGFRDAYEAVALAIQNDLNGEQFAKKPLLITGHSLGGALATIAAKKLKHRGGIAACYTFGAPRVGDEDWSYGIKTPIYRVVNAIDGVTMLPPGQTSIWIIKFAVGFMPWIGNFLQNRLSHYEGYIHVGDERYLTSCKPKQYQNVKLTYGSSFTQFWRIIWQGRWKAMKKFLKDHSIEVYRKKLTIIALRRNPNL